MTATCKRLQECLAAGRALEPLDRLHLEGCDECAGVRARLAELDEALAALRADAPEGVVDRTLRAAAVVRAARAAPLVRPARGIRQWAHVGLTTGLAFALLLVLFGGRTLELRDIVGSDIRWARNAPTTEVASAKRAAGAGGRTEDAVVFEALGRATHLALPVGGVLRDGEKLTELGHGALAAHDKSENGAFWNGC